MATFYNRKGTPVAYLSGSTIYLFRGEPVAYIHNHSVYSFSGKHLGRYAGGWVRDHRGSCVFFAKSALGKPERPEVATLPPKRAKKPKPIKGARQKAPTKPANRTAWSGKSSERFFNQ